MDFFTKTEKLYPLKKIKNPPSHVKDEISLIIKKIKKNNIEGEIVDFGCGTGRLTIPLLKAGYKIVAIDINKTALKKLKENANLFNIKKNLKTSNILLIDKKYQLITGTDILHHLDINKYFSIFYKSLKKGGKIIFSEPNFLNPFWWIYITLFVNWKLEWRIIYCHYFSIFKNLKKTGFRNINITGFGLFPPQLFFGNSLFKKINYFLGNFRIFKLFAYRLIIEGEKC